MVSGFGTFRHDACLLLDSNISYNRWERPIFVPEVRLMTLCELTSGSVFIARQHTDARYWYSNSVCKSVRPSVRPSLCPSVCAWRSGIRWKRLNISS